MIGVGEGTTKSKFVGAGDAIVITGIVDVGDETRMGSICWFYSCEFPMVPVGNPAKDFLPN